MKFVLVLKEDPSSVDLQTSSLDATTFLTVASLERLLDHSKALMLLVMKTVFAKHNILVENVEKSSIKIYLTIPTTEQLETLWWKMKDRTLHKEICSALEEARFEDFIGSKVKLVSQHLMVTLQTMDGILVDSSNLRKLFVPDEMKGMILWSWS